MNDSEADTIGVCPECGAGVQRQQAFAWCRSCRQPLPAAILAALPLLTRGTGGAVAPNEPTHFSGAPTPRESYSYKVVPFRAQFTGTASPDSIASQLETAILNVAVDGFELYQVATVTLEIAPGCFGSLLGQRTQASTYEQLIFRRLRR